MVIMKLVFIKGAAALLLLISNALMGQLNSGENKLVTTFSSQIRFSLSANIYDNLRLDNTGTKILKSYPCPTGETSIGIYQHLSNNYGLIFGAGLTLAPFNFHFNFTPPDNDVYRNFGDFFDNYFEYIQFMYVFSLSLQKTIVHHAKPGHFYSFEAGLKQNMQVAFPYEITNQWDMVFDDDTELRLFSFELHDTGKRNLVSGFVKVGKVIQNKKGNTFHFNLVFNYSPQKLGEGEYKFHELGYDSYGTVTQNINYIGFEFAYGLTLKKAKFMIDKMF
jgi:hypothetical protein